MVRLDRCLDRSSQDNPNVSSWRVDPRDDVCWRANPVNMCYTTGLGHVSPRHPLHIDSRLTHQPPPPGLTVGGPIDVRSHKDYWAQKIVARYCHPPVDKWPTLEAYWDVFWYPPMCEFTVQTPMARNAYAWGYLAGRTPTAGD